ncbi:stealth family protein [Streptomyces halobius]|uniref:Stealth family protein n=1 Tax=Streptomyces halobius TaxID=2879846 RepID=A0ABY4M848_9ACTN|nr:stealth family protein [Streptomyces halobius]UQA92575.1 stealth family protein [Streptomyces halobius]
MRSRFKAVGERLLPTPVRERRAEQRRIAKAEEAERKRAERIAQRRQALLESDSALREIVVDGRTFYGRVVDGSTAADTSARNLNLVADALEQAGIGYFLVPGHSSTRHVLGVRLADRKRFLESLRELYRGTAFYAATPSREGLPAESVLYADGALPTAVKRSDTIRFGEILLGPAGQVLADLDFGCDVEFWRDGSKLLESEGGPARIAKLRTQAPPDVLADALVAPRRNAVSDVLPAAAQKTAVLRVRGRDVPTFAEFLQPRIDAVDFPIDVVYTWVDGSDPELRAKREFYRTGAPPRISARETGASRYTSHDELKYSLRSLEMYAEFIRHVYVVTDGQTPSWLNLDAPGITVVDHKEIFSDPDALPVFNSHAIGTQLHHIPGLSEHYLYFNDDVFVGRPMTPQQFFHGNGIARLPFSPFQFGLGEPHPEEPAPNSAGKNVRQLLLESNGRFITNKFMHTPHPQIRSVMRELEERFAADIDRTSRSRFRSTTDIAMGASLHHHYAHLTGRAVPGTFRFRYVDIGQEDAQERLAELERTHRFDFFCLNDVDVPAEAQERVTARLHTFLESYFPYPSAFERT